MLKITITDHTQATQAEKEANLIAEYRGSITIAPTQYSRENKQAPSKEGFGEMMSTSYSPYVIEDDEQLIKEYNPTLEYHSYGYEYAMTLADISLYRKLMGNDPKFIKTLSKVKKHIKRKARISANHISKDGTKLYKSRQKRAIPKLPSQL